MSDDTAIQKIAAVQRCVAQARKARSDAGDRFRSSYLHQDAAVMNIVRACETSIDLANMLIRRKRFGIPGESRESFSILVREGIIDAELGGRLERMVGFRNVAVHRYKELDPDIVEAVILKNLDDLLELSNIVRLNF